MKVKVFVDGLEGTTGLKIHERLDKRTDIEVLLIDPDKRKDKEARSELINAADLVFLCLPDDAAKESLSLAKNKKTRFIDASTAHRTDPDWVYGLPELNKKQRKAIADSTRVSVPGCHATGFITALAPLVQAGIIGKDYPVSCTSVSGYSGGGKKLIAMYEEPGADHGKLKVPRHYALGLNHKHLPEMQKWTGLQEPPVFTPIVGSFYQGMAVSIPLYRSHMQKKMGAREIHDVLSDFYAGEHFIRVMQFESESYLDGGFFSPLACNHTNRLELFIFGNDDRVLLMARLDNLGKGASGAAVQNMNIMIGLPEEQGLEG